MFSHEYGKKWVTYQVWKAAFTLHLWGMGSIFNMKLQYCTCDQQNYYATWSNNDNKFFFTLSEMFTFFAGGRHPLLRIPSGISCDSKRAEKFWMKGWQVKHIHDDNKKWRNLFGQTCHAFIEVFQGPSLQPPRNRTTTTCKSKRQYWYYGWYQYGIAIWLSWWGW